MKKIYRYIIVKTNDKIFYEKSPVEVEFTKEFVQELFRDRKQTDKVWVPQEKDDTLQYHIFCQSLEHLNSFVDGLTFFHQQLREEV